MTVEEFKAINADLPTERNGITIHLEKMHDDRGFFLFLEVPLEAATRELIRIAPLVRKWQRRILAQYDSAEAEVIGAWAKLIDSEEATYSHLQRKIHSALTHEIVEYNATGNREHHWNAIKILIAWGYTKKKTQKAFEIVEQAERRLAEGKTPFETDPIDADRVRNRINRWKRKQKTLA